MRVYDLPGSLPVHLLEFKTAVNDDVLPACSLVARQADPDLIVEHPQKQSWQDGGVGEVHVSPSLGDHPVCSLQRHRCEDQVVIRSLIVWKLLSWLQVCRRLHFEEKRRFMYVHSVGYVCELREK